MNKTSLIRLEFSNGRCIFLNKICKKRIMCLAATFIIIISLLTARLSYLQIYPSKVVSGEMQNHQTESISELRYGILDTNGKDMMKYDKSYVVVIDSKPFKLNNYEETFQDLMALNYIMKEENKDFNYSDIMKQEGKLYYNLSKENYDKVASLKNIKGVYTYTYDKIDRSEGWKVNNFLSNISEAEPIENSLEWELMKYVGKNDNPKLRFYLDDKSVYSEKVLDLGESANNLKLTINSDWYNKVEEVLQKDEYSFLKNIGVVLVEAETGKVRVMAQKDETRANVNLAIDQLGYEPGSVFKTITLAVGLNEGKITTQSQFKCVGDICTKNGEAYGHGTLTVQEALNVSCNEVFAQIGTIVGYDKMMEYCKNLGLFSNVLNLQGERKNEAIGTMPKSSDSMNNISIGQVSTVTPLQMAGVMGTIANDGIYTKPTIVEEIVDKDDNVVKKYEGEQRRVFSETTAKIVQQSMREVISMGSAYEAKVDSVEQGGKTGTAQGNNGLFHGWFGGYFVLDDVKYGLVIIAPEIGEKHPDGRELGGGNTGAPIFKDIINKLE